MKKIILSVALIATSFITVAQVGIGTVTPSADLEVVGDVVLSDFASAGHLSLTFDEVPGVAGSEFMITHHYVDNTLLFTDDNSNLFLSFGRDTGRVGIGTDTPGSAFEVVGAIKISNNRAGTTPANGMIRFTGTKFQGRVGGAWVDLH